MFVDYDECVCVCLFAIEKLSLDVFIRCAGILSLQSAFAHTEIQTQKFTNNAT